MAEALGAVCREHRRRAGLRMLDIATTAGVSQARIGRFELGQAWVEEVERVVDAYARECGTTPRAIWQAAAARLQG